MELDHFLGYAGVFFQDGFWDGDRRRNPFFENYNDGIQRVKNKDGLRTHNVGNDVLFFRQEIHLRRLRCFSVSFYIGLDVFGFQIDDEGGVFGEIILDGVHF